MGKTPGEEALRVVFREFKEAGNAKVLKICARPLVGMLSTEKFSVDVP
jgi:hypothetical protein